MCIHDTSLFSFIAPCVLVPICTTFPYLQKTMSRPDMSERDGEGATERETKNRLYVRIRMDVCLWPIDVVYIHVAHTNTNGIFLCYRHSRPKKKTTTTMKKREKERARKKAHRSLFIVRRSLKLGWERGRERQRRKISARYTPLYAPVLSIDVSIRCCHSSWPVECTSRSKHRLHKRIFRKTYPTVIFFSITCHSLGIVALISDHCCRPIEVRSCVASEDNDRCVDHSYLSSSFFF